jgi:hypothetical protein
MFTNELTSANIQKDFSEKVARSFECPRDTSQLLVGRMPKRRNPGHESRTALMAVSAHPRAMNIPSSGSLLKESTGRATESELAGGTLSGGVTRKDLLNAVHNSLDPLKSKDPTQCDIFEHALEWVTAEGIIA